MVLLITKIVIVRVDLWFWGYMLENFQGDS